MSELQPIEERLVARKLENLSFKNDVVMAVLQFSGVCSTIFLTADFTVGWTPVGSTLTGIALGLTGGSFLEILRSRRQVKVQSGG